MDIMLALAPHPAFLDTAAQSRPRAAMGDRLLRQFHAVADHPSGSLSSLRSAATAYGRIARDEGLLPEQLVIALKRLLCCRGGFKSFPSLLDEQRIEDTSRRAAYAHVLQACLEGYFETT